MNGRKNPRRRLLAATTALAGFLCAAPVCAQDLSDKGGDDEAPVTVIGHIPASGDSASPVQLVYPETAAAKGVTDMAQFLQSLSVAAGSTQINAAVSGASVTEGGPGVALLSLRGLGPNRSVILLNGRRLGPAGTRGQVDAVDLNVLPLSLVQRIEILKDGGSSIHGSDAIAGAVNIVTTGQADGGRLSAFYTAPQESGGAQAQMSARWSRTFARGHVSLALDYNKQFEQRLNQRTYTACAQQFIFDATTGARADAFDPRTGDYACLGKPAGQIVVYDFLQRERTARLQYDFGNNLAATIPTIPSNLTTTCSNPATNSSCYPKTPAGFFLVGYNQTSRGVSDANSPFEGASDLIPEIGRTTVYGDGSLALGGGVTAYGEVLLNRRDSIRHDARQFWTFNYTSLMDSFSTGFTGQFALSPTIVTDWFGSNQRVDYVRGVLGLKGDFQLHDAIWHWNVYGQQSRSNGSYTQQVILKDAIDSQTLRTKSCVGTTLPVSGRACIDINFLDPTVLAGNLTQAQRAFLFDTDTGVTRYVQTYGEAIAEGELFRLPAGPLNAAFGLTLRRDSILDTPGPITLAGNSWGLTSGGVTKGAATTSEAFAEFRAPLARTLSLEVSGRYTNVSPGDHAGTYKAGLSWRVTPQWRLRGTVGTSFRSPALYELYLSNQTTFLSQRSVDPCIGWAAELASGLISQRVADNCANPAGPGGGVASPTFGASSTSAVVSTGGGLGTLRPERSLAVTAGIEWRPAFADLGVTLDYYRIRIRDEVTSLGDNTPYACYSSESFPTDPVCSLFVRNATTHIVTSISSPYINIAYQVSDGVDLGIRYGRDTPWGKLVSETQLSYRLTEQQALFFGFTRDNLGNIGHPRLVGSHSLTLKPGAWTLAWSTDYVGQQSVVAARGGDTVTVDGTTYKVKATAPNIFFHSLSAGYDFKTWSLKGGVVNLLATKPPQVTTLNKGLGFYPTVGTSAAVSQYAEGFYGRRFFIQASKRF